MRRLPVALAPAAAVGVLLLAGVPAPAAAESPAVASWYSAGNVGAAAAPPPPDVQGDDLFVQGSNAGPPGAVPGFLAPPSAQAVSALSFALPLGARVGALRLRLDPAATPPPASSVVACRVTKPFRAVKNGPYADAPPYDAAACVPGQLAADAKSLSFDRVAALVRGQTLAVALIPGPLDRVVLAPPASDALAVTASAGAAPPFNPATGNVPGAPLSTAPGPQGAPAPLGAPVGVAGPGVSAPLAGGTLPPAAAGLPAPVVAVPGATTAAPAGRTGSSEPTSSGLSRLLVAVGLVALLAFSLLGALGSRLPGPIGRLALSGSAGNPMAPRDLGVGRFRATRQGKAPRLL